MLLHIYDLKNKVPGYRNYLFVYRNVESDGMAVRADECKLAIKKNLDCFSDLQATGSEFLGRKGDKTKPICDLKQ